MLSASVGKLYFTFLDKYTTSRQHPVPSTFVVHIQDVFIPRLEQAGMRPVVFAVANPSESSFRALMGLRNAIMEATGLPDHAILTLPESTAAGIEHLGAVARPPAQKPQQAYSWLGDMGGATSDQAVTARHEGKLVQQAATSVHIGGEDLAAELSRAKCIVRAVGRTQSSLGRLGKNATQAEVRGFTAEILSDALDVHLSKEDYNVAANGKGWKHVRVLRPVKRNFLVHEAAVRSIINMWAASILAEGAKAMSDVRPRGCFPHALACLKPVKLAIIVKS